MLWFVLKNGCRMQESSLIFLKQQSQRWSIITSSHLKCYTNHSRSKSNSWLDSFHNFEFCYSSSVYLFEQLQSKHIQYALSFSSFELGFYFFPHYCLLCSKLPVWDGLYMALSVCMKIDTLLASTLTSAWLVWVIPPVVTTFTLADPAFRLLGTLKLTFPPFWAK